MNKNKTEEILNSLDGASRAASDPYLYSRIISRLESGQAKPSPAFLWRLAFALLVIAALNVVTLIQHSPSKIERKNNAVVIAGDYNISLPASY